MPEKIRVLHVIKSLGRGGAEMLLPETLKLHDKAQFEFHYIYFLPWKNQLVSAIREAGGIIHCFQANNNLKIIFHCRRLHRYIRKHQIDFVHCHLPWAGFVGRLLFRFTHVPVIYTEHNKQERYHGITFFLNKLTFNWQTRVIAVSEDVRDSIQVNINPRIPVQTILNGVNTDTFVRDKMAGEELRTKLQIPEGALVVGTIAVFRFQKRLIEWLEVAKAVIEKDSSVYFIMVGDGPLKEEILARRASLKLEDRVIMAGLQVDVKPWLSAMDVYMMTSIFEGLPIALLEAMSMECAVLTTNAGGIKEVIRDGEDGILVDVSAYHVMVDKLEVLKFKDSLQKFKMKARQRVVDSFSLNVMVIQLEKLYTSIAFRK